MWLPGWVRAIISWAGLSDASSGNQGLIPLEVVPGWVDGDSFEPTPVALEVLDPAVPVIPPAHPLVAGSERDTRTLFELAEVVVAINPADPADPAQWPAKLVRLFRSLGRMNEPEFQIASPSEFLRGLRLLITLKDQLRDERIRMIGLYATSPEFAGWLLNLLLQESAADDQGAVGKRVRELLSRYDRYRPSLVYAGYPDDLILRDLYHMHPAIASPEQVFVARLRLDALDLFSRKRGIVRLEVPDQDEDPIAFRAELRRGDDDEVWIKVGLGTLVVRGEQTIVELKQAVAQLMRDYNDLIVDGDEAPCDLCIGVHDRGGQFLLRKIEADVASVVKDTLTDLVEEGRLGLGEVLVFFYNRFVRPANTASSLMSRAIDRDSGATQRLDAMLGRAHRLVLDDESNPGELPMDLQILFRSIQYSPFRSHPRALLPFEKAKQLGVWVRGLKKMAEMREHLTPNHWALIAQYRQHSHFMMQVVLLAHALDHPVYRRRRMHQHEVTAVLDSACRIADSLGEKFHGSDLIHRGFLVALGNPEERDAARYEWRVARRLVAHSELLLLVPVMEETVKGRSPDFSGYFRSGESVQNFILEVKKLYYPTPEKFLEMLSVAVMQLLSTSLYKSGIHCWISIGLYIPMGNPTPPFMDEYESLARRFLEEASEAGRGGRISYIHLDFYTQGGTAYDIGTREVINPHAPKWAQRIPWLESSESEAVISPPAGVTHATFMGATSELDGGTSGARTQVTTVPSGTPSSGSPGPKAATDRGNTVLAIQDHGLTTLDSMSPLYIIDRPEPVPEVVELRSTLSRWPHRAHVPHVANSTLVGRAGRYSTVIR